MQSPAAQTVVDDPDATVDELKAANKAMTKAAQELWEIVSKAELNALDRQPQTVISTATTRQKASRHCRQRSLLHRQWQAMMMRRRQKSHEAITNLSDAIASLEKITLDTSALEHEIELVTEMIANIDDYVPSSVEGLQEKLDAAKTVLNNATSTGRDR